VSGFRTFLENLAQYSTKAAVSAPDLIQAQLSTLRCVAIAGGVAVALCIIGPIDTQEAVGKGAGQARSQPQIVAHPVLPTELPRVISATGYDPAADGRADFVQPPPDVAYELNKARPISTAPNPAARPFSPQWRDDFDHSRATDCLTAAIYYEAASEGEDGQRAVAQVVLNRVRHPAFAKSVCAVVFQGGERKTGCQFTFVCDGSLARRPIPALWEAAHKVAAAALAGAVYKPVGYATHYHTVWVVPYWGPSLVKLANIGQHIFYRWDGGWGGPAAFKASYVAAETQTDVDALAAVAPIAQKVAFVIAEARPASAPRITPREDPAPELVSVEVKPLEVAAAIPLTLPAAINAVPQALVMATPSTVLSRSRSFSRLAAPPGW
jgi:hypothetical protein